MKFSALLVLLVVSLRGLAEPLEMWERPNFAVEYGDRWRAEELWRYYPRILGSLLISVESSFSQAEVSAALTNVGAPLEGYTAEASSFSSFQTIKFEAPRASRSNYLACPKLFDDLLSAAAAVPGVRAATPFLLGDSLLRFAAFPEILFRMEDGFSAATSLSQDDLRFYERRNRDVFVFPKASHWEIYRKTSQLTLHPHIRHAEPNGLIEGTFGSQSTSANFQRLATFEAACGPAPVSLQILPRLPQSFQISFSHPLGELIIFEAAPDLSGPWTVYTNFIATKSATFDLPGGSNHTFIRAIHQ